MHITVQKAPQAPTNALVKKRGLSLSLSPRPFHSWVNFRCCQAASEKSGKKVQLANLLCNGNYAVSGDAAACDAVMAIAKPDFKARMTIRLAVAGAFHTDFMLPAVASLKEVLETVDLKVMCTSGSLVVCGLRGRESLVAPEAGLLGFA